MPSQRRKRQTVQRLRQKLRELHPRHDLVRFVHRLTGLLHAVFVHHKSTDQTQATAAAPASATPPTTRLAHKHHHRESTPLAPPRQTPPGYQSIRCVTPTEHEEGLHDHPPPGVPYHPYRPYRSYEDFRAAEAYHLRELQAIEELREARRRASTGLSYERLVASNW